MSLISQTMRKSSFHMVLFVSLAITNWTQGQGAGAVVSVQMKKRATFNGNLSLTSTCYNSEMKTQVLWTVLLNVIFALKSAMAFCSTGKAEHANWSSVILRARSQLGSSTQAGGIYFGKKMVYNIFYLKIPVASVNLDISVSISLSESR